VEPQHDVTVQVQTWVPHEIVGHLHAPPTQESPAVQTCPQVPQLAMLVLVLTQPVEHIVYPAEHTHAPFVHVDPVPQVCVVCHAPVVSHVCTAPPLHCEVPGMHATQPPFRHTGVALAHAAQFAPQCAASELVL